MSKRHVLEICNISIISSLKQSNHVDLKYLQLIFYWYPWSTLIGHSTTSWLTLNQYLVDISFNISIDTQLPLDWNTIDISIDTRSTVDQWLAECWPAHMYWSMLSGVSGKIKTLNLRKGQQTKQRNRILLDLISKIWNTRNWKTEKLTVRLDCGLTDMSIKC